jgi:hypothetical protein
MRTQALFLASALAVFVWSHAATAQSPADGYANSQLRRTVDPSERSAAGTVNFTVQGLKQTCSVQIEGLGETDFGIFVSAAATPDTNTPIYAVAPLDRTNEKKGAWSRKFASNNGLAPLEFPVDDLHALSGGILVIGKADTQLLETGVTNVVNGATNIVVGIPLPLPDSTNIVGGVLWAPIPMLTANPSDFSYSAKVKVLPPEDPAPSPKAKATAKIRFNGASGQSVLDIRAKGLVRGQTYTVYVGDSTNQPPAVLIPAGTMEPNKNSTQFSFIRDTAYGDPLPQQVRDVVELSGRRVDVRDNFGNNHLSFILP